MMANDTMLGGVYLLMAIVLVSSTLLARRERASKFLTMALAWIAIFAAGFVLFTFRDNFGWVAQRLKAEASAHRYNKDARRGSRWRSTVISGSTPSSTAMMSNSWSIAVLP